MADTKLTMLIDLSSKLFNNGLSKMQNKWSQTIGIMDSKYGAFLNKIPMLGGLLDKLKTPIIGLGIAAVGAFSAFTVKGIDAAKKFDAAFTPIRNINLDKSKAELDDYRLKIRDAAYETGTNLADSTSAVFDLQSATGIFGDDAISIFKKVGTYSLATGANIGDAMNSTTKAMKAFGLSVDDIDKLLESNAKTVTVGITTFDELAKVQTVFAGAASSAGQQVDTANKVFAMFTSIAKNSDIASMMTKTFFQGMGQQAENFKKVLNIDVFDKEGIMRQADELLKEIAGKFKNMNNKEITEAINNIGGPEGLRGALAKVSTGAEDMINVFSSFDDMTFNMSDAMKNAEGDITIMSQIFQNKLETLSSKFGEKFFPMIAGIFDKLKPVLDWLYENFDTVATVVGSLAIAFGVVTAATWAWNAALAANPVGLIIIAIVGLIALVYSAIKHFDRWGAGLMLFLGPVGMLISAFKSVYDHWESIKQAFKTDGMIAGIKRIGIVLLDALLKPLQQVLETIADWDPTGLAKKALSKIKTFREDNKLVTLGEMQAKAEPKEKKKEKRNLYEPDAVFGGGGTGTGAGTTTGKGKLKDDVNKVTGDARQVKNITINIDSLNKGGINMTTSGQGMSQQEVEDWFNNMMMRIMRNAELS